MTNILNILKMYNHWIYIRKVDGSDVEKSHGYGSKFYCQLLKSSKIIQDKPKSSKIIQNL